MAVFGPYYYGRHKWDKYLLDIQETINAGNATKRRGVRVQEETLNVAREQVKELYQQTERLHHIEQALQNGFDELRAEFEWGFTLVVDRLDKQIRQLSRISERLGAIHDTLRSPLQTEAEELFQLGQERYTRGLDDKALEAYLKAEQKIDVDFRLQFQIGKLFLYGRDVINLPQAEKHLVLAARYADGGKERGEACFHAAVAAYLIGEQQQAAGRTDSMRGCLERALNYLATATILWPQFTEIVYTQAKCHALLGNIHDAAQRLTILSDRDRRYYAKAAQDGDFGTFRATVEAVFKNATISPGPLARAALAKIDVVAEAIAWARRSAPRSTIDLEAIESIERDLGDAKRSLATLDVDIEALIGRLSRMTTQLEQIAQRWLQHDIDASQTDLSAKEALKSRLQNSIEDLRTRMKATKGNGAGCVSAFLACVIAIPVTKMLEQQFHEPLTSFFVLTCFSLGFLAGASVSRGIKNEPLKSQVKEHERSIEECVRSFPLLQQQVEYRKQEMQTFVAWQNQQPASPLVRSGSS
jgi:hypothetical protein